jgi:hypothetical protein
MRLGRFYVTFLTDEVVIFERLHWGSCGCGHVVILNFMFMWFDKDCLSRF